MKGYTYEHSIELLEKRVLALERGGGGSGGTTNYNDLENKPSINSVSLSGNKSLSDLGIPTELNELTSDSEHRTVSDEQISYWDSFNSYSLNEDIRVGTWIDGRPIYRHAYKWSGHITTTSAMNSPITPPDLNAELFTRVVFMDLVRKVWIPVACYFNELDGTGTFKLRAFDYYGSTDADNYLFIDYVPEVNP